MCVIICTIFYTFTSAMRKLFLQIKIYLASLWVTAKLRKLISPIFIMMLAASFVLWYIAKLSYTYTTELNVRIDIEEQILDTHCVIEGVGTNLFGYKIRGRKRIKVPISELRYEVDMKDSVVNINRTSLNNAISVRFSDIKIISIDADYQLKMDSEMSAAIEKAEKRR